MLGNFSFNDAYRIIKNVVDERINMLIRSGAGVEITWGTVAGIDNPPNTCSVYLFGDSMPSSGFRLENGISVNVLDPVRVAIDKRGNRWVDGVLNPSGGGVINVRNRTTTTTDKEGTAFPSSPVVGQRFWRTDWRTEYFYNGSNNWIPVQPTEVRGGQNMLRNGSFEQGLAGWSYNSPPTITQTEVVDGRYAAVWGAGGYRYMGSHTMVFKAGKRYTASFWITGAGTGATVTAPAGILFEGFTGIKDNLLTFENHGQAVSSIPQRVISTIPAVWTRYWVSWVQETDRTNSILVVPTYGGTSTGEIRIDAVMVQEGWPSGYMESPASHPLWIPVLGGVGFQNSWTNYGFGYPDAAYWRDPHGFVHLRGLIKSGVSGTIAFNLPAGFRHGYPNMHFAVNSGGAFASGGITSTGAVTLTGANVTTWVDLAGMYFEATTA